MKEPATVDKVMGGGGGGIFRELSLGMPENGSIDIPRSKVLPKANIKFPYVKHRDEYHVLGDEVYSLTLP